MATIRNGSKSSLMTDLGLMPSRLIPDDITSRA